jgi:hypothetical protein
MMIWPCRLKGRINVQSGAIRRVNRLFDGAGDVNAAAREVLAKRKDKGSPWYGDDTVTLTTPLGQRVQVDIPWPEVGSK